MRENVCLKLATLLPSVSYHQKSTLFFREEYSSSSSSSLIIITLEYGHECATRSCSCPATTSASCIGKVAFFFYVFIIIAPKTTRGSAGLNLLCIFMTQKKKKLRDGWMDYGTLRDTPSSI